MADPSQTYDNLSHEFSQLIELQIPLTDLFIPKMLDEKLNSENGAKKCLKLDASTLEIFDFEQINGLNKTLFKGNSYFLKCLSKRSNMSFCLFPLCRDNCGLGSML